MINIEQGKEGLYYATDPEVPNLFAMGLTEGEGRRRGEQVQTLFVEGFESKPDLVGGHVLYETSDGVPFFVPNDEEAKRCTPEQIKETSDFITRKAFALTPAQGYA